MHLMMQQAQDLVTMHTECVNAIHDVLLGQVKGHVDDSNKNRDEGNDAQCRVVDDNV
jgi:hypothetical protein